MYAEYETNDIPFRAYGWQVEIIYLINPEVGRSNRVWFWSSHTDCACRRLCTLIYSLKSSSAFTIVITRPVDRHGNADDDNYGDDDDEIITIIKLIHFSTFISVRRSQMKMPGKKITLYFHCKLCSY